jgi:signal peptidase
VVDSLLWTLGGLGLLSLIAAVVAHIWGFSIILFSTGSMTPTIPAGSAALVRLLPASDFHVGDITTVERQNLLPITHRITSIKTVDGSPSAREITMRGDANDLDDPQPYVITNARLVVASVAGVATWFAGMRDPRLMALLTLLAGGLVMWAFWPRTARKASIVAAAVVVAGSSVLGATDANAAGNEYQVVGRHMVLTVISDTQAMTSMVPGSPVLWQVGVARRADEEGALHIGLGLADGTVDAAALKVDVQACPERWQGDVCEGAAQSWVSDAQLDQAFLPATHDDTREFGSTLADKPIWILVRATMTRSNPDVNATLKLAAWGNGEVVSAESDGPGRGHGSGLAYTGPDGLFGTLSLAGAAIGTGLVIARLAGHRRRESDEEERR